eukprot:s179_g24.t1
MSTGDFQQKMRHEVELLSFGRLKMQMIPELPSSLSFFQSSSDNPSINPDLPTLDPQYMTAIRPAQQLGVHLQRLADYQLRDWSYEKVRKLVCEILRDFKRHQKCFLIEERIPILRQLLPILDSKTLQEAKEAIAAIGRSSHASLQKDPSQGNLMNIPLEVLGVIQESATWQNQESEEFPAEAFQALLENLGKYFKRYDFEGLSGSVQQGPSDFENALLLYSSNVQSITDSELEKLLGLIEEDCEDADIEFADLKIYLGHSSFWLLVISPVKLDTQRLQRVVANFVEERRLKSFAWAFATAPTMQPWFAAPGLWQTVKNLVSLMEKVEVPQVMWLRARELKRVALQLLRQRGEEIQEWQVRVVSNSRDLKDEAWIDAQRNDDFHFVTHDDWQTLHWKERGLHGKLKDFAEKCGLTDNHTLHATAYLAYELQRNPPQGLAVEKLTQRLCKCQEPKEMLSMLVRDLMDPTSGYSTDYKDAEDAGNQGYLQDLARRLQEGGKTLLANCVVDILLQYPVYGKQVVRPEMIKILGNLLPKHPSPALPPATTPASPSGPCKTVPAAADTKKRSFDELFEKTKARLETLQAKKEVEVAPPPTKLRVAGPDKAKVQDSSTKKPQARRCASPASPSAGSASPAPPRTGHATRHATRHAATGDASGASGAAARGAAAAIATGGASAGCGAEQRWPGGGDPFPVKRQESLREEILARPGVNKMHFAQPAGNLNAPWRAEILGLPDALQEVKTFLTNTLEYGAVRVVGFDVPKFEAKSGRRKCGWKVEETPFRSGNTCVTFCDLEVHEIFAAVLGHLEVEIVDFEMILACKAQASIRKSFKTNAIGPTCAGPRIMGSFFTS